jgi:hypothetical protein
MKIINGLGVRFLVAKWAWVSKTGVLKQAYELHYVKQLTHKTNFISPLEPV